MSYISRSVEIENAQSDCAQPGSHHALFIGIDGIVFFWCDMNDRSMPSYGESS